MRFMSKYRATNDMEEQRKFLGLTWIYYIAIAFIATVIGIVMVAVLPTLYAKGLTPAEIELAQKLLILTVINIVVTLSTSCFSSTIVAYENHFVSKGITIGVTFLKVGVGVILLLLGFKSIAIVALHTILSVISRVVMVLIVFCKLKIVPTFKGIQFSKAKEIVSYSGFILLQMVATQINSMADQVLIGALVSSASVVLGVYAVGSQVNQYFKSFGGAINGTIMPGVVRMIENNEKTEVVQAEMTRIGRLNFMFIGIIWCVFLVFGEQFVALWAGAENSEAYLVALILMLPYVFIEIQSIGTKILWVKNKHKMQAILKFIVVILNIALTVFLIQWHALYGAVLGTFISLMVGDVVVMQIVFKKNIGIRLLKYYKDLCKGILPALIVATVIGFAFRFIGLMGWLGFICNCAIMLIVYLLFIWFFGLNNDEKHLIGNIFGKIFKRKVK